MTKLLAKILIADPIIGADEFQGLAPDHNVTGQRGFTGFFRLDRRGMSRGNQLWRHVVEKEADRHVEDPAEIVEGAGTDPVHAALVFLNLLEAETEHIPERSLADAKQGAADAQPSADMPIDRVRPVSAGDAPSLQ